MTAERTAAGLVATLFATMVLLVGCGASAPSGVGSTSVTDTLWSARTAYVGDNSRVIALVRQILPASDFGYTIGLHAATKPYGLMITIARSSKPYESVDFTRQATALLGLIANLDTVTIASTSSRRTTSLTTAAASRSLGYDVKELGRDQAKLAAFTADEHD